MTYFYIFIGGGLGALSRFALSNLVNRLSQVAFPYGTLAANVLGSFLIGLVIAWFESKTQPFTYWKPLLVTGFLGGFTTFSSFSYETMQLFKNQGIAQGLANAGGNVVLCIVFVYLGYSLTKAA
ncbi:fluoride efflux transporter CrcB [uncultured Microscilla sp.]|uniref:fluoride efflux transporter CrcB n=1 Tax=uncultured Microscilla sp. TaxID=432653 RepID=UPI00262151E0|nr:fluoride efflux transporter CrcB [uncultured Microscilla sp.]